MVEAGLFAWLKEVDVFRTFSEKVSVNQAFSYDICFNNWPLNAEHYQSQDYKDWLKQAENALGSIDCLFKYWSDNHSDQVMAFVDEFVNKFNALAEINEYEVLPPITSYENENA